MQLNKGHSLSGDRIGRDKSGHGKVIERGALTFWRPHRKGQVRTREECDRAGSTHFLETASEEQIRTERKQLSEVYSLPGDSIGRVKSGTSIEIGRMRLSEIHSHPGDRIERDKSRHRKNATERGALTA
jgi:hypothetical protein